MLRDNESYINSWRVDKPIDVLTASLNVTNHNLCTDITSSEETPCRGLRLQSLARYPAETRCRWDPSRAIQLIFDCLFLTLAPTTESKKIKGNIYSSTSQSVYTTGVDLLVKANKINIVLSSYGLFININNYRRNKTCVIYTK